MRRVSCYIFLGILVFFSCGTSQGSKATQSSENRITMENNVAILAGGCFWCIEAPFLLLDGVESVVSGYIGGQVENPTYKQVCTGSTGHAEAIKVVFDSTKVSYDQLLEVFFVLHDPTQLNRQGNDIGTQYRSAIFPVNAEQEEKAKYYIASLGAAGAYDKPIVTSVEKADVFYTAEDYHQNYYNNNPNEMYCQLVAKPKLDKLKKVFADRLKTEE